MNIDRRTWDELKSRKDTAAGAQTLLQVLQCIDNGERVTVTDADTVYVIVIDGSDLKLRGSRR